MKPVTFSVASSMIRMRLGRAPRYIVALPPVNVSAGEAKRAPSGASKRRSTGIIASFFMGICLRKDQVDLAPVFLCGGAFAGPVRRVIQLVGDLRRPEASVVTVEEIALHGRAETRGAAARIGLPSRGEDEGA